MPLAYATILPPYKTPVLVKGQFIHEHIPKMLSLEKRKVGDTNIDLWLDNSLYPLIDASEKRLGVQNVKDLLEIVGDGEQGLLGYIQSIERMSRRPIQKR